MHATPGPGRSWNTKGRGQVVHSMTGTTTYKSWSMMKQRCYNPKAPDYARYGALGIRVCDRWHLFENFLADMGVRPQGLTLDRIDSTKDYSPDNCRWSTPAKQAHNRRNTKLDEVAVSQIRWLVTDGNYSQAEVGRAFSIHPSMVSRIAAGHYWKVSD